MSTSSNKQPKKGEDGMGKAGKRKEMVEDRCVQEMHVEGRCVKEFRVKVMLVKEVRVKAWCVEVVCGEESCVKVLWVKERYGTGVDVKALRVQVLRGQARRPRRQLGTKRATRASPTPKVPRLPRKVHGHVSKCHACHAK